MTEVAQRPRQRRRHRAAPPPNDRLGAAVRGLGELFITLGAVLLLFCAYQLWWTNVEADRAAAAVTDAIEDGWEQPAAGPEEPAAVAPVVAPAEGEGFAFVRIPRLGEDFRKPVLEGVRRGDLQRGVGHYPGTAMPGETGNFAIAGHRTTYGQPFHDLDQVETGDPVVVETADAWYVYEVEEEKIVRPSEVEVIEPVPGEPGVEPTEARLTITTCHPRFSARQRLIVHAVLVETRPKADGEPPALLAAAGD